RVVGVLVHEMVHAIGFPHEQSRWDRDRYVTIQWDAIKQGRPLFLSPVTLATPVSSDFFLADMQRNFYPVDQSKYNGIGIPYDYASVMHYHQAAFSKNGRPTIVAKNKLFVQGFGRLWRESIMTASFDH